MEAKPKPKKTRNLKYLLHAAVVGGVALAAVKMLDGDLVWRALHRFNWGYLPLILGCTVTYVLAKGWRFVYQLRQLTRADRSVALRGYVASQACTLIPGGFAARAGILAQAGVPVED